MSAILSSVFAEIAREADANPRFRQRLLDAIRADASPGSSDSPLKEGGAKPRNRREKGVLDPYEEILKGEDHLRGRLSSLTVEELKDVVSEHSLDSARLALKWKSAERLVDLIVLTVRGRLEKGDAFRGTV
jgi:hypothetical protein